MRLKDGLLGDKAFWLDEIKPEQKKIVRAQDIEDATRMSFDEARKLKEQVQELMKDEVEVRIEGTEGDEDVGNIVTSV